MSLHHPLTGETTIRLKLTKEGAAILTTSVVGAVVETTEDSVNTPTFAHRPQQSSLDFEIEPEAYRGVEALVKSLAAGKCAFCCVPYVLVECF